MACGNSVAMAAASGYRALGRPVHPSIHPKLEFPTCGWLQSTLMSRHVCPWTDEFNAAPRAGASHLAAPRLCSDAAHAI
eukprot:365104-Chlamydomonas_euryale.AAC.18